MEKTRAVRKGEIEDVSTGTLRAARALNGFTWVSISGLEILPCEEVPPETFSPSKCHEKESAVLPFS